MIENEIPEVVVARLPVYLQKLNQLAREGLEVTSSDMLAESLGVTASQIRKDLSYFGGFGKQGTGYNVISLMEVLQSILHLDRIWKMAVVGVGNLGQAVMSYQGFARKGFEVVLAFDSTSKVIGRVFSGIKVQDVALMEEKIAELQVKVAVLTVPATEAQRMAERLAKCGVRAILNYAPVSLKLPEDIQISNIYPVLELQKMAFYLE